MRTSLCVLFRPVLRRTQFLCFCNSQRRKRFPWEIDKKDPAEISAEDEARLAEIDQRLVKELNRLEKAEEVLRKKEAEEAKPAALPDKIEFDTGEQSFAFDSSKVPGSEIEFIADEQPMTFEADCKEQSDLHLPEGDAFFQTSRECVNKQKAGLTAALCSFRCVEIGSLKYR